MIKQEVHRMKAWNDHQMVSLATHLAVGTLCVWILGATAWSAPELMGVEFVGTTDPVEIRLKGNDPLTYERLDNVEDKQLILEFKGTTISKTVARKIDTSSFDAPVSLISPYQVEGQPDTVRVVVQLRDSVEAQVNSDGNNVIIKIPNTKAASSSSLDGVPPANESASQAPGEDVQAAESAASTEPSPADLPTSSDTPNDIPPQSPEELGGTKMDFDSFASSQMTQKFIGKAITLQIRDGDVADVLRLISEASGFNIVMGEQVKGKLNLSLIDVPWDQALDIVMRSLHLGAERNNNVLMVDTLTNLAKAKQEELDVKKAAEAVAPRLTRVFPLNYASPKDLQLTLSKFVTNKVGSSNRSGSGGSGPGSSSDYGGGSGSMGGSSSSSAGSASSGIQVDERINSLIVQDTPQNLEKMQKLVELLDIPTAQVLIEAKIIEASDEFSKSLTGSLGIGGNRGFGSFGGINPVDSLFGTPGVFADGSAIASLTSSTGAIGYSPSLSFLPGLSRMNALLNLGENESQLKVVASPKTVVINKGTASIVEGTPVLIPSQTVSQTGSPIPITTVQQANISLNVKPTVTNDGNILMDLTVTKDVPKAFPGGSGTGIANRNMTTSVMVETGTTLVIGGIYNMTTSHTATGFPFLRNLPLIGALFGTENSGSVRSEIFIFVTPRILDPKNDRSLNG